MSKRSIVAAKQTAGNEGGREPQRVYIHARFLSNWRKVAQNESWGSGE